MPKTIRNELEKKLTYEKLMEAHKKSKKGKGYRKELIEFNLKQEEYIMWLYEELKNKTYKHGGYQSFYITEPKIRKIEKSRYIDRIVHRWLVDNFLEPYFVPTFINTTFACIKERGMHRAAIYVQNAMKKAKVKWKEYYILKMDISKYFDSIIIVKTKEEAKKCLEEITTFLDKELKLKLNKKTQIFKNKQGVNFCGYKINEYRMKLRDKGKRKLKKKVKKLTKEIYLGKITSKEARKYLAGHMGYIKYANVKNLISKLFYIE